MSARSTWGAGDLNEENQVLRPEVVGSNPTGPTTQFSRLNLRVIDDEKLLLSDTVHWAFVDDQTEHVGSGIVSDDIKIKLTPHYFG